MLSAHSQFIHPSFINSFTHTFLHSFCHSYIFLFIHPFILSFTLDFHNMISLTLITGILWKNCHDRCVCLGYKEGGNCERVKYKCFLSSKAWQCQCVGDEGPQKGNKGAGKWGESQESQESHLMIYFFLKWFPLVEILQMSAHLRRAFLSIVSIPIMLIISCPSTFMEASTAGAGSDDKKLYCAEDPPLNSWACQLVASCILYFVFAHSCNKI